MINWLVSATIVSILCYGILYVLQRSDLLSPKIRNLSKSRGWTMLVCPYCLGFWICLSISTILYPFLVGNVLGFAVVVGVAYGLLVLMIDLTGE